MSFLGVDYSAGRKRQDPRFRARRSKVKRRFVRVKKVGKFASNAFLTKSGLGPQIFHPVPLFGMQTSVLNNVRKSFACNLAGYRVGNSTTLSLMLSGARKLDPMYSVTSLVAISWARRVQDGEYPILFVSAAWDHWIAKPDLCRRPWSVVSGPIPATYLSLRRVGCRCTSAIVWVTPSGTSLDILVVPLAEIASELRRSIDSYLWNLVSVSRSQPLLRVLNKDARTVSAICSNEAPQKGARTPLIFKCLARKSPLDPGEKSALRTMLSGGVWTPHRKFVAGSSTSGHCGFSFVHCNQLVDCTLGHLCWECPNPEMVALRSQCDVDCFVADAIVEMHTQPLWTRALLPLAPVAVPALGDESN